MTGWQAIDWKSSSVTNKWPHAMNHVLPSNSREESLSLWFLSAVTRPGLGPTNSSEIQNGPSKTNNASYYEHQPATSL